MIFLNIKILKFFLNLKILNVFLFNLSHFWKWKASVQLKLSAARSQIAEMTQELTKLRAEHMNTGTYQAQAREVPALRQV